MPEAPINENGDTLYAKNKIGAAKHGFVPLPARDPMLAGQGSQRHFGGAISLGPNAPHQLGALFGGKDVRHAVPSAIESRRAVSFTILSP